MNRHINWDSRLDPPGMDIDEFCPECGEETCEECGECNNEDCVNYNPCECAREEV